MTDKILNRIYDEFGPEEGEDYALGIDEGSASVAREQARYWGLVNDARAAVDALEWDGVFCQSVLEARSESDPNLLADRLLVVAANAIAYANSVQRQTAALNAEGKGKAKGGE